jgi:hypothetical protein
MYAPQLVASLVHTRLQPLHTHCKRVVLLIQPLNLLPRLHQLSPAFLVLRVRNHLCQLRLRLRLRIRALLQHVGNTLHEEVRGDALGERVVERVLQLVEVLRHLGWYAFGGFQVVETAAKVELECSEFLVLFLGRLCGVGAAVSGVHEAVELADASVVGALDGVGGEVVVHVLQNGTDGGMSHSGAWIVHGRGWVSFGWSLGALKRRDGRRCECEEAWRSFCSSYVLRAGARVTCGA